MQIGLQLSLGAVFYKRFRRPLPPPRMHGGGLVCVGVDKQTHSTLSFWVDNFGAEMLRYLILSNREKPYSRPAQVRTLADSNLYDRVGPV